MFMFTAFSPGAPDMLMPLRTILTGFTIVSLMTATLSAGTVIQYDTEGVGAGAPTVTKVNAINPGDGITGIDVTRGAGLTAVSASFAINSSGWNDLAADDYYQFGFMTTRPYVVDTLTVGLRSSNTGPGFMDLVYSKDGGAFTGLTSANPIELFGTTFSNLAIDLTGIGVVSDSLVFRLIVDPAHPTNALFNQDSSVNPAIGANGTFRFASYTPPGTDLFLNPEITGSAVPEPSAIFLAGIGLLPVFGVRLMRQNSRKA
jgi:hypothetical protein